MEVAMAITAREQSLFDQLQADELSMVSNYAASLIRNRTEHTEAYYQFQKAREKMLKENPMTDAQIDDILHQRVKA